MYPYNFLTTALVFYDLNKVFTERSTRLNASPQCRISAVISVSCSHVSTKPAKASDFIFEWCWYPETKTIHFAVWLKLLSPLHQLFTLSPPTQTVCVAQKSSIPLLGLFGGNTGKFSVRQEISSLRPMTRWEAKWWCLMSKISLGTPPTSQGSWISYTDGVPEGGLSLLAKHNREWVCSAERRRQRVKLEPEAETEKGCNFCSSRGS